MRTHSSASPLRAPRRSLEARSDPAEPTLDVKGKLHTVSNRPNEEHQLILKGVANDERRLTTVLALTQPS